MTTNMISSIYDTMVFLDYDSEWAKVWSSHWQAYFTNSTHALVVDVLKAEL